MTRTHATLALATLAALGLAAAPHTARAQVTVQNNSFETPPNTNGYVAFNSTSNAISGWDASGFVGINYLNDNGMIPGGSQVAFVQTYQGTSSTLTQTLTGFKPGDQYVVTFYDNARTQFGNATDDAHLSVTLGGQTVVPEMDVAPVGGNSPYHFVTSLPFIATGPTADLVFENVYPGQLPGNGNGDTTALLDEVNVTDVTPAPEPSQTAALGLGLLGLAGLALKARKRRAQL